MHAEGPEQRRCFGALLDSTVGNQDSNQFFEWNIIFAGDKPYVQYMKQLLWEVQDGQSPDNNY